MRLVVYKQSIAGCKCSYLQSIVFRQSHRVKCFLKKDDPDIYGANTGR